MRKNRIRSHRHNLLWLSLCALGLCAACIGETRLHRYHPVGKDGWERTDTLEFPFSPDSADSFFRIHVGMRVAPSFSVRSLCLAVQYNLSNPDTTYTDTLCYELSDTLGSLTGRGVTRLQYEHSASPLHLHPNQSVAIRLYHLMKKETLPGVCEVGIRLEESSHK